MSQYCILFLANWMMKAEPIITDVIAQIRFKVFCILRKLCQEASVTSLSAHSLTPFNGFFYL